MFHMMGKNRMSKCNYTFYICKIISMFFFCFAWYMHSEFTLPWIPCSIDILIATFLCWQNRFPFLHIINFAYASKEYSYKHTLINVHTIHVNLHFAPLSVYHFSIGKVNKGIFDDPNLLSEIVWFHTHSPIYQNRTLNYMFQLIKRCKFIVSMRHHYQTNHEWHQAIVIFRVWNTW